MPISVSSRPATPALVCATAFACAALFHAPADAQTLVAAAKSSKARRIAPPPKKPLPETVVPDANGEQISAAEMVFYGHYECEFNQVVDILPSPKHAHYVDVKHGKGAWLMRPVLSSTGAIRLEDLLNETLMVQIASKSMLLNVKTGHRIVDACISPKQRELMEAARAAKAADAAAAAASGVAPAPTPAPLLGPSPAASSSTS